MKLLLAPSGRGKTNHVLQRVRALQNADPLTPVWVITPNQQQAKAFRRRLAGNGGALGVEIWTFYGIYAEVLARQGKPQPRLFDPVQHRLLRAVVDHLCEQGALAHYAPLRDKPGFLRRLRELITELKRARISTEALTTALAGEQARLTELAAIYRQYQAWLIKTGWADAEGQGWLAALALERDPTLASGMRLLVVDGFDEFNPTQLAVLKRLAQRSTETIVTLTGEPTADGVTPRDAHRRFMRAYGDLRAACPDIEIRSLPAASPDRAPALAQLETALFAQQPSIPNIKYPISLIEARNRSQEARMALRWLKQIIVRDNLAPDRVAVLARDMTPYRAFLSEAADEFGMELQLAGGEDLLSNPAIVAVLNLLSLPVLDWPQRAVLDAWRSPYFDWSAQVQAGGGVFAAAEGVAASLAEVVRGSRVIGGLEQWREAFTQRSQISEEDARAKEQDRALLEGPVAEKAAALSHIFESFVTRIQPFEPASLAQHIAFVEDLIGDDPRSEGKTTNSQQSTINATRNTQPCPEQSRRNVTRNVSLQMVAAARQNPPTADRDVAALQAFKDVLRGLMVAESILHALVPGSTGGLMPYRRFWSELRGAVEVATYRLPASANGAILAAPVLHARGLSFDAVALLGLSEGEFPQQEQEDPLLRDAERQALVSRGVPLQPRVRGDEPSIFYEAVTRARCKLLLTRPYLTDDGQAWEPSPYWQEIRRLVDVEPQRAMAAPPVSIPELLVAGGIGPPPDPSELPEELAAQWLVGREQMQRAAAVLQARLARQAAGVYEGDAGAVRARLHRHYPPGHVWSSSKLEAYATCPFLFFVRNGLGLEPRAQPEEGFDVLILGNIYHAILENVYRQAIEQDDWSETALLALLSTVSASTFADAPHRYGFRPTAIWRYQQEELTQVLAQTLAALAQVAGDYRPYALEQAFGLDDNPPLEVDVDEGSFRLRGYIDRIDQDSAGRLRIIDYKSGSKAIRPQDLDEGKRIQLPLYALAASEALSLGEVAEGFYWHIGSAKASGLQLGKYGVEAAMKTASAQALRHIDGIRSGRFSASPPAGGCPGSCAAIEFCWRVRKGWG